VMNPRRPLWLEQPLKTRRRGLDSGVEESVRLPRLACGVGAIGASIPQARARGLRGERCVAERCASSASLETRPPFMTRRKPLRDRRRLGREIAFEKRNMTKGQLLCARTRRGERCCGTIHANRPSRGPSQFRTQERDLPGTAAHLHSRVAG
jgi:hypothetical protein